MPFNINPPCEEEKKTIIRWQFPGQEEKSNNDGDDYEISLSFYDCPFDVNLGISYNIDVKYGSEGLPGYDYESWQEPNSGGFGLFRVLEIPDIDNLFYPVYRDSGHATSLRKSYIGKLGRVGNQSRITGAKESIKRSLWTKRRRRKRRGI